MLKTIKLNDGTFAGLQILKLTVFAYHSVSGFKTVLNFVKEGTTWTYYRKGRIVARF